MPEIMDDIRSELRVALRKYYGSSNKNFTKAPQYEAWILALKNLGGGLGWRPSAGPKHNNTFAYCNMLVDQGVDPWQLMALFTLLFPPGGAHSQPDDDDDDDDDGGYEP